VAPCSVTLSETWLPFISVVVSLWGLSINVGACFLIGLVLEFLNRHSALNPAWRFLIAVGFIGGFSTFSTFTYETWSDLTHGYAWLGLLYAVVSLGVGLLAVNAGAFAARVL
jgi:CrcB protein